MNGKNILYPQKDRLSYLWLIAGSLIMFLWRAPIVWWISPIFLVRFMRSQSPRRGFFILWAVMAVSTFPPMYTIVHTLIPVPLPIFLLISIMIALGAWVLPYVIDRWLAPRLPGFWATLPYPLAAVLVNYISSKANPLGGIGGLGYTQYSNLPLLQILAITGMWGVVFLVSWLGPVVNYAWERGFEWPLIRRNTLVYGALMLVVFLYGGVRLAYAPEGENTARVHGITEVDQRQEHPRVLEALREDWDSYRQISGEIQEIYLEATRREAQAGAQIVHWPEMAISMDKADEPAFLERAAAIAVDEEVYLVISYTTNPQGGGRGENKLVVLDPAGEVVLTHFKYALANMEGTTGADKILHTVETPFGTLSGLICNDTNHEEVVTQAGRNGTDLLFSPSLELRQIDPLMAHIATYRAIENGVTLIRQADNGLSLVVDPYGRVTAAMDHFNTTDRVMVAQVPILSAFTLYPYLNDAFAWLAILGLIGLVVWGRRSGERV